jgi:hypothetical protein
MAEEQRPPARPPGLSAGALTPGRPPTNGSVAGTRGDNSGQVEGAMAVAVEALHDLAQRAASDALYDMAGRISSHSGSGSGSHSSSNGSGPSDRHPSLLIGTWYTS